MVLINTQDNYTLAPELTEGMEQGSFPIVILTKSDGISLAEFLEQYYGQDVLARLDIINMVDTHQVQHQQLSEIHQQEDPAMSTKGKRTGSETTGITCTQMLLHRM